MLLKNATWKILLIVLFAILTLSHASRVSAEIWIWKSIGPEGGDVRALAIDPQTPTTVYAGIWGGGVFKSTNGGASWSAINNGLTENVKVLAIDPQTPSTVYAGTEYGVFKTTNGGANWNAINNGLTSTNVQALAIDPQKIGRAHV